MVEHVSRSHEVPSSNLGHLLLHLSVSINVVIFFVVLKILVVVRAIPLPILSQSSSIRECSRVILLQNKFNSLPIYLHTPSGDIVPGHLPRARRVNFKPTSSGTPSACHKAISKSHFVGSPDTNLRHTNLRLGSIPSNTAVS